MSKIVPYATGTRCTLETSRRDIGRVLARYGAKRVRVIEDEKIFGIEFEMADRRVRFVLHIEGSPESKENLRLMRSLLMCIKNKLEMAHSKIETFDHAFFVNIVMPNGRTFGDELISKVPGLLAGENIPMLTFEGN